MKSPNQLSLLSFMVISVTILILYSCVQYVPLTPAPHEEETQPTTQPVEEGTPPEAVLQPPSFAACMPADPPVLPEQWQAVGLMMPFTDDQLVVGEFVSDSMVPALRATLYGLEAGSADFLITNDATYLLAGSYSDPTGCVSLGNTGWQPPSQEWLGSGARCVGEAPILEVNAQWWKTPANPQPSTTWYWYTTDAERLPWRTMFASESQSPAVIGMYSMTNFPIFEAVAETNLPQLVEMCSQQATAPEQGEAGQMPDLAAMLKESQDEAAAAERADRIQTLIPGLSYHACAAQTLPTFPDQFGMTTFMTAVNFDFDPFPTEVLYQWSTESQRTRMFQPESNTVWADDALLLGGLGYDIQRQYDGSDVCQQVLPGTPRPDWMMADNCGCKGVIDHNPQLSPGRTTQVITCPLVDSRVFWTWYTTEGRPVVFMETASPASEGTGLALADYYQWAPDQPIPPGTFDLPANCPPPDSSMPKFHHDTRVNVDGSAATDPACYRCHLGPSSGESTK